MNVLKREIITGIKSFLFWALGLFVLIFAGMTKFTGIESAAGSANISEMINKFPKVVLAVMGMVSVDVNTLGGYYSVIAYYVLICATIFAVHIGINAVSRETFDKTYEFIFTKPCSRSYILRMKLFTAWIYITLFCILNYVFSVAAIAFFRFSGNLNFQILLFSVTIFLISSLFSALSAFISVATKQAEKGASYSNLCFLLAFIMGVIYDTLENGGILKLISPFKYFSPADLLNKKLDPLFAAICVVFTIAFLWSAFEKFQKKDFLS
jgi:ABC-2 type transport system permease protein